MPKTRKDEARERRISTEIVVDAYGAEEQAMGWYYYLEEKLKFPFEAKCIAERSMSPLAIGDKTEVLDMAPEDDCQHEMFVMVPWEKRGLAVPLMQLKVAHGEEETHEAVEDWHYWVCRGYTFG